MTQETKKNSEEFISLVEDLRKEFQDKYGISISYNQATKILAEKIKNAGGFRI